MHTDSLFLQLFRDLPSCFFELIGRPDIDPTTYKVDALEFKPTAFRLDGIFWPLEKHSRPAYVWEAQLYASNKVYGNLVAKMGQYWTQTDPDQELIGVVIYPSRSFEQKNLGPYRKLLDSRLVIPVYLDELPPPPDDRFDLGILQMITASQEAALEKARQIVRRVRKAKLEEHERRRLLQFKRS